MSAPQFYGSATAEVGEDDAGSCIMVEVSDDGGGGHWKPGKTFAALTVEAAAKLAEQIDAAIDELARTARAKAEARAARIAALRETLAELEEAA